MDFNELKEKYKDIDICQMDYSVIIIKDFIFKRDGGIFISRQGYNLEGIGLSIFSEIAQKRTPEQMDMFLTSIL